MNAHVHIETITDLQPAGLTVRQAAGMLNAGAVIVDIRENCAFNLLTFDSGTVINIPSNNLVSLKHMLPPSADIILADLDGSTCIKVFDQYRALASGKIYWMAGGLLQWKNEGFPVKGTLHDTMNAWGEDSCQCYSCCRK